MSFWRHFTPVFLVAIASYWIGWKRGLQSVASSSLPKLSENRQTKAGPKTESDGPSRSIPELLDAIFTHPGFCVYDSAPLWHELEKQDLAEVWRIFSKKGISPNKDWLADEILSRMAVSRPREALAFALEVETPALRGDLIRSVIFIWGMHDPKAAMETAVSQPATRNVSTIQQLASNWGSLSPQEGVLYALQMPKGSLRNGFLKGLASGWAIRDIPAFCIWANTLSPSDGSLISRHLLDHYVVTEKTSFQDVNSLWKVLQTYSPHEYNPWSDVGLIRDVSSVELFEHHLAEIDNVDPLLRKILHDRLVETLFKQNPETGANWLLKIAPEEAKEFTFSLALHWGDQDSVALQAWAESLSDKKLRQTALFDCVRVLASRNPDQALTILQKNIDVLKSNSSLIYDRVIDMVNEDIIDLSKVANFVYSLDDEDALKSNLDYVINRWFEKDMAGCSQWITQLPVNATKDEALTILVYKMSQRQPKEAVLLTQLISDPTQQRKTLLGAVSTWIYSSPEEAAKYIKTRTDLTSEERLNLSRTLERANDHETEPVPDPFSTPGGE